MSTQSLDDIRREIDGIDDAILDLLIRRFEATARVRSTKSGDGSIATSPFRPAREAAMLRRLVTRNGRRLPPELLVRLWRVILSASTQAQAPVIVHVTDDASRDAGFRALAAEHFCGMDIAGHGSEAEALNALALNRSHLAVLPTRSGWARSFGDVARSGVRVIGALPVIGSGEPAQLIFGHVDAQPSGDDETIVISANSIPSVSALWQCQSAGLSVTSLSGFLVDNDVLLAPPSGETVRRLVAGRLPRPIEVLP